MELITLIETLENNLTREIVNTKQGNVVSYTDTTPKTVTVNSTPYNNVNRLCLMVKNNITYLYINSYDTKKLTKIAISTITTITIGA